MIESHKVEIHWNYFLAIENDLDVLARFIEFDENNFECYSLEIARLLLAAAAECDVVCKQLCRKLNPSSSADNINNYRDEITSACSKIYSYEIAMPRYGLKLKPWSKEDFGDVVSRVSILFSTSFQNLTRCAALFKLRSVVHTLLILA